MIKIICIGSLKEKYLKEATNDYLTRLNKYHKINLIELPDSNINEEKDKILKNISPKDYIVTLDILGEQPDSINLAKKINNIFIQNSNITFIIGGSYGIHEEIKKLSNYSLSFSKLTFPHGLFRVILLEQIYRSFKILNNESYHK